MVSPAVRLTPSTSARTVRERLGVGPAEALRESEKRRRYLEKYCRLLAPVRPTVRLSGAVHTATTDYEADQPEITITTRAFDQPASDLRRPAFDLAVQEALVVHELGHLLYTDIGGFHDRLEAVAPERRRLFARVWNTLEDGAIERQLRHRYDVATELELLNANLFAAGPFGHDSGDGGRRYSLFNAVLCGLADMAVYDSGRFRRLLDGSDDSARLASRRDERLLHEFRPRMERAVRAVVTEPDPGPRTERIGAFWTALTDRLDDSTVSGAGASELDRLLDPDGTIRAADGPSAVTERRLTDDAVHAAADTDGPLPGKPDDTAGPAAEDARKARELRRDAVRREVDRQIRSTTASRDGSPDTDTGASGTDGTGHDGRDGGDDPEPPGHHDPMSGSRGNEPDDDASASGRGSGGGSDSGPAGGADGITPDGWSDEEGVNGRSHPGSGPVPGSSSGGTDGDGSGGAESPATSAGSAADGAGGIDDADTGSVAERHRAELAAEANETDGGEARLAELQAYLRALTEAAAGTADGRRLALEVVESVTQPLDRNRWETARRRSRRLARSFRTRLQEQRRDTDHPRQRRGSFDRGRLVAAARGRLDVFTRTEAGEERAYTCVLVVDRSASMADGAVEAAEDGAAALALALEAVGVDVTTLDLHGSSVRLVNAEAEPTRTARRALLAGEASGGTPLADALRIARFRLHEVDNPFVLVVTDGRPDDRDRYLAELEAATFPVLGVYLTDGAAAGEGAREDDESYFHGVSVVEDWGRLDRRLHELAAQVLF